MSKISVVMPIMVPTPFLRAMTEFAIKALRNQASGENEIELIVVEAGGNYFDDMVPISRQKAPMTVIADDDHGWAYDPMLKIDKYLSFNPPIGGVREVNRGIDAATGDYIVFTGNDIFVCKDWDKHLLYPFQQHRDCGISTLGVRECGSPPIGSPEPIPMIVEGMFSPFCMFKREQYPATRDDPPIYWRYDEETYFHIYQDSDLVLRMYEAGLRAYRNLAAQIWHLGAVTNNDASVRSKEKYKSLIAADQRAFYKKWDGCPYAMFGMIRAGHQIYGREYEAHVVPIQ